MALSFGATTRTAADGNRSTMSALRPYIGSSKLATSFLRKLAIVQVVAERRFLTTQARVLVRLANDPEARIRDVAASLEITERTAFAIMKELVEAGYLVKGRNGRRNRHQIQASKTAADLRSQEHDIRQLLDLLPDTETPRPDGTADPVTTV
jgi:DNA-binding MarR family transcriptional regulator